MADETIGKCQEADDKHHLKQCAKCNTALYCNRDCQKADWKNHRKVCSSNAIAPTKEDRTDTGKHTRKAPTPTERPFTNLVTKTWLHNRPKEDVYALLVDAYRLRVEDEYRFEHTASSDSLYGGCSDGRVGFRRFLRMVEQRGGFLPSWWSHQNAEECVLYGLDSKHWSDLTRTVAKADIIEHYGDIHMPMQLRIFAEDVYDRNIFGPFSTSGVQMAQQMAMFEDGTYRALATIDNTTGRMTLQSNSTT